MAKKNEIEEASKKLIEEAENNSAGKTTEEKQTETRSLGNVKEIREQRDMAGNAISQQIPEISDTSKELGFKNIPLDTLPSQGLFYPAGTKIFIKAASGAEIKHWSTIDEDDGYSIEETLNFIVERCAKVVIPGQRASYKDLKDIDRFWLLFAIREYTFKDGENKLYADVPIPTGNGSERVEVTKNVINYYKPSEKMMKYYDEKSRCFTFPLKNGEIVTLYFPNVGISTFLKDYRKLKEMKREQLDEDFAKYSLFLFPDWRGLSNETYEAEQQKSHGWSVYKISLLSKFVDLVKESINPSMTVVVGGGEVTVPLNFRGGLKALFLISDILDELE